MACDFQQCGILTSVDTDEPGQPPFKPINSKWCSVGSLTIIQYSSDLQRLWSDCAYLQAGLSPCWPHIPHCWKSHVRCSFHPYKGMLVEGILLIVYVSGSAMCNFLQIYAQLIFEFHYCIKFVSHTFNSHVYSTTKETHQSLLSAIMEISFKI